MNKLLILATSALFLTSTAQALPGDRGPCAERGDRQGRGPNIERMQERLALSDDQAAAVDKIFTQQHRAAQKLRRAHCDAMQQHRNQTRERLSSVLSEDQMQQIEAQRQNRMEQRRHQRHQWKATQN